MKRGGAGATDHHPFSFDGVGQMIEAVRNARDEGVQKAKKYFVEMQKKWIGDKMNAL